MATNVRAAVDMWVEVPSWHEFVLYFEGWATDLLSPAAARRLEEVAWSTDRGEGVRRRAGVALQLLEVARAGGVAEARKWMVAQLSARITDEDRLVRQDAMRSILVLAEHGTVEWCELLEAYLSDVLAPAMPSPAIEAAIALVDSMPCTPDLPSGACALRSFALGRLHTERRAGERATNLAIAFDHLRHAVELADAAGEPARAARARLWLGKVSAIVIVQDRRAALVEACAVLDAAAASGALDDREMIDLDAVAAWVTVELARRTPNTEERRQLLTEALERYASVRSRDPHDAPRLAVLEARARGLLAEFDPGERDQAFELLRTALPAFDLAADPYNWSWARTQYVECALELGDPPDLDELAVAAREAEQQLAGTDLAGDHRNALSLLGEVLLLQHKWEEALVLLERLAAKHEEELPALTAVGREAGATLEATTSATIAYCLCRLGRSDEAVVLAERGKTGTSLDLIAAIRLAKGLPGDGPFHAALVEAAALEVEARKPVGERRSDGELARSLAAANSKAGRLITERGPVTLGEVRQAVRADVPPDGALLSIIPSRAGTAIVVLARQATGGEIVSSAHFCELTTERVKHHIGLYALFLESARDWSSGLDRSSRLVLLEDMLALLADELVGHLAAALRARDVADGAHVVITGSLGLTALPLHAAADKNAMPTLSHYDVSIVPSTLLVGVDANGALVNPTGSSSSHVLHVINPTGDLPYADLEGDLIATTDPSPRRLQGAAATPSALVAELGAPWATVHLACHASFEPNAPWQSHVVLRGGQLTAADVLQLDLSQTTLVTLSACETGVSDVRRAPAEAAGLRTAFLIAGAQSVLATLWRVDDASTSMLVRRVQELETLEGSSTRAALWAAQAWLRTSTREELSDWVGKERDRFSAWRPSERTARRRLKEVLQALERTAAGERPYVHPYYWAPFTLWSRARNDAPGGPQ